MTVALGVMELPAPEDGDSIRRYETGTIADGGLWTALRRAADHDHSGGQSGALLNTASAFPPGSITTSMLDPSVLAPYSLTDGSKPFTGQVTLQADAVIRDALHFGEQGTALAPDATLQRAAPGALTAGCSLRLGPPAGTVGLHVGAESPALAWYTGFRVAQIGGAGALVADPTDYTALHHNSYTDAAAVTRAARAAAGVRLAFAAGALTVATAPSVAAGATQTFTTRMALAPTGTLTLTPDAGQAAIDIAAGPGIRHSTGDLTIASSSYNILLDPFGGYVRPTVDAAKYLGHPSGFRWHTVYALTGTINTSSQEYKEGATPLSPSECYEAAKAVRWYDFRYTPPPFTPPEPAPGTAYDASDSNEVKAEKKAARDEAEASALAAHARMLVETAPARHQRSFVFPTADAKDDLGEPFPPVPDLFGLDDRESTTPGADVATLGCALQEVIRRLEALEAGGAA